MQILKRRGWELPEREATPEAVFRDRRRLIQAAAAGSIAAAAWPVAARAATTEADPTADLYPGPRNPAYTLDRPLTPEKVATTYNNFYEFGSSKGIWKRARDNLRIRPWTVHLDGDVEKPVEIGFDDLVRKLGVEERLYRHRCVEAWAMAVPWSGFPMAKLVEFAKPLAKAKYVRMETFNDPDMASGQKEFWYPWPYVEGVTMEEATNELAFIVTGLYGKPVPALHGSPELHGDLAGLTTAQKASDRRLIDLVDGLDDDALGREVVWTSPSDTPTRDPVAGILLHLFQHQIHHRGQVHDLLAQTSVPPPQLDEYFLTCDAQQRAEEMPDLGITEVALAID